MNRLDSFYRSATCFNEDFKWVIIVFLFLYRLDSVSWNVAGRFFDLVANVCFFIYQYIQNCWFTMKFLIQNWIERLQKYNTKIITWKSSDITEINDINNVNISGSLFAHSYMVASILIHYKQFSNRSIWLIDGMLKGTTRSHLMPC